MPIQTPDWLARRGGELKPGVDGPYWLVCFEGEPQYRVEPVPVKGKHGCKITQTINGRTTPCDGLFATVEEALQGGLEALRKALGW